jgi:hypothetical protein
MHGFGDVPFPYPIYQAIGANQKPIAFFVRHGREVRTNGRVSSADDFIQRRTARMAAVLDNPLFPFPERLFSVFSALGEKANS